MKGKRGYTIKEILTAIEGSGGIISAVAQRLDCDWRTAEKYIKKWDATRAAFESERERVLDWAETTIVRAIRDGDVGAAKWYLSRMGRHRGWGDTLDVDARGDVDIVIRWADDDSAQDD